jgi:hypothetical protein
MVEFLSGFTAVNTLVPITIYERGMARFFRQVPSKVYAAPPP